MGKRTTLTQLTTYLDADKAALFDKLATDTRIPKAELLREAVADLLMKYGLLKGKPRKP